MKLYENEKGNIMIEWDTMKKQMYDFIALYDHDTQVMRDYIEYWNIGGYEGCGIKDTGVVCDKNSNYYLKYWRVAEPSSSLISIFNTQSNFKVLEFAILKGNPSISISGELGEQLLVNWSNSTCSGPNNFIGIHNSANSLPHHPNRYIDWCYANKFKGEFKSKLINRGLPYYAVLWGKVKGNPSFIPLSISLKLGPSNKRLSIIEAYNTNEDHGPLSHSINLNIRWHNNHYHHIHDYVFLSNNSNNNNSIYSIENKALSYLTGETFLIKNYPNGICETSYQLKGLNENEDFVANYCSYSYEEKKFALIEQRSFKEYSNWISIHWEKIKNKMLRELVIPGSHDAASYGINSSSKRSPDYKSPNYTPDLVISKWSKTQSATIYKQLLFGVRYFDLRVAPYPMTGELWTIHNMFSVPISQVLDDIERFMMNAGDSDRGCPKREILILHWNHLEHLSNEQHVQLQTMIKQKFSSLMAPRSLGNDVTVQQLEKTPIINVYDDGFNKPLEISLATNTKVGLVDFIEFEPLFWYGYQSLCSSYETKEYHTSNSVIRFLEKEIAKTHSTFWVLQCILTVNSQLNFNNIVKIATDSLFSWNNSEIQTFLNFLDKLEKGKNKCNIIMTDFCTFMDVTQYAIRRNTS
ncbi:hypothetical protein RB653_007948 [Dictyostelium firmibasis]|uniref:Phosphatidylinositol-specific phospholipase C X domain-containing protein n=1 Tax=Dictyostelium firmibasis TaxID=79012 RepID=A0AAN7TPH9_9MYCE